jgi:uncharacterized protein with PQ loop repeat
VVVFSPQIIENFRRRSADGLSLLFLAIWLAGDVFNILGSVLQGVLPTMTILAVYYTLADIVLLGQCFYYRGFTLSDNVPAKRKPTTENGEEEEPTERTGLLNSENGNGNGHAGDRHQQHSQWTHVDGTHLSPVTPFVDAVPVEEEENTNSTQPARSTSILQAALLNTFAIVLVCAAGILGWYVSSNLTSHSKHENKEPDNNTSEPLAFDFWGQIFGYLCAVLYLGSRIPQLLLNYRRKSTEGVSLLFFLFACIGNLTYVLSIFAYSPVCFDRRTCQPGEASAIYGKYILVNLSWLVGSLGTLILDMAIFVQFFLYRQDDLDDWE